MPLEKAMQILEIVKCDSLGYARDLSYTPSRAEIGLAITVVQEALTQARII